MEKLPNTLLDGCSFGIEFPNPLRVFFQIGNQDMIGIFPIFEEAQLLGFDGVFRNETSRHNESMILSPTVGLISKLPYFPSIAKFFETARSGSNFDGRVFFSVNHIAAALLLEPFNGLFVSDYV